MGHGIPLLVVSSRAVYGEGRYECRDHRPTFGRPCCAAATPAPSREDDPHHPVSVYGETKSLAESVATAVCGDRVPLTVVRPAERHRPGPGAAQPLHRGARGLPRHAARAATAHHLRRRPPDPRLRARRRRRRAADPPRLHPPDPGEPLVLNSGTGVRTSLVELAGLAADAAPRPRRGASLTSRCTGLGDIEHACADLTRLDLVGAPAPPVHSRAQAVHDFVRASWDRPGCPCQRLGPALGQARGAGPPRGGTRRGRRAEETLAGRRGRCAR